MKISLRQIKNILMEVRDIEFFGEDFSLTDMILNFEAKSLNTICREIVGKDKDYSEDLLGEDGGLEVISDFLLSIIDSYKKSKSLRVLIKRFLPAQMQKMMKLEESLKSEQ